MKTQLALVTVAVAVLGCNPGSTGLRPGVSNSCTVTLTGAITGTYNCEPATTAWGLADGMGVFSFGVSQSGSRPGVSVAISWVGEPTVGDFTSSDVGAVAHLALTMSSNQAWLASVGEGTAAAGTYTLAFTSVVNNISTVSGNGYSTEGTLTASLTPVAGSGSSGTITMSATF